MWPFNNAKKARQFIKDISRPLPFTPDKAELSQSQYRLMFVCDDMMRAHKGYERIKMNSAQVSRGFTKDSFDFRIGRHTGIGLPFMGKGLKIKGELHAVETDCIHELDKHYKNGVEFARCRVGILVVDRDHQLMHIGQEEFLKNLPNGMIWTVPELGIRHYLSDQFVCIIKADMYIAIKKHWAKEDLNYPHVPVVHPKEPTVWLPQYFKYPINRNR